MNRLLITLLLAGGALLQTVLQPLHTFGGLELPVLTGLVICISLRAEYAQTLYAAVLAGLLHDAFSPAPLGLSIPFFAAAAQAICWIRDEVFGDLPATYIVLGAVAAVCETLYYAVVFSLSGLRPVYAGLLGLRLAGSLLSGAVIVPLIWLSVFRIRYFSRSRRRYI